MIVRRPRRTCSRMRPASSCRERISTRRVDVGHRQQVGLAARGVALELDRYRAERTCTRQPSSPT